MDEVLKYFPELTNLQIQQFSKLGNLYREWNKKINVISRKDIDSLYLKHVLHSLAIAKIISFVPGTRILDAGTGGGFPGIPLAIFFPTSNFILIDSIGKKIKVVNDITENLGLENVSSLNSRAEDIDEKFDFVVSRAVKAFPLFYSWVNKRIHKVHKNSIKNGILYLKGGDIEEEIKDFKGKINIFPINEFFSDDFFSSKFIMYMPV